MTLFVSGSSAVYEIESLARMIFPNTRRASCDDIPPENFIIADTAETAEGYVLSVTVDVDGKREEAHEAVSSQLSEKERSFILCRLLYSVAERITGSTLRWGMLTGIRPIKLYHQLFTEGFNEEEISAKMQEKFLISDEMNALALSVRRSEAAINEKSLPKGFSLYISIPFCPQRCSYCSFVSSTVERMRALIPSYVEHLCREIKATADIANSLGLTLQTVYFGGGTPTTLNAEQLSVLFDTIRESFDCSDILEFTVEAGRPDTIDRARLTALKNAGVGRISINPQSMNDDVLAAVGRAHTAEQITDAYALAREIGFDSINMDLIAGLAEETAEQFLESLDRVIALKPENVTVHTLTLKRASTLSEQGETKKYYLRRDEVTRMVDGAREKLSLAGYEPYYLYRQKNTVGALDNTGYALPGKEGCYNVFIMDETHSILACGAGAVTKLRAPYGDEIERIYNFKFPDEYMERFDDILKRKEGIVRFYENYLQK